MELLDHHSLVSIFKHLDLPSRLQAKKTCKLWRSLLQDSEALLDDVGEVYLNEWTPDKDKSEAQSVVAVSSNLKRCRRLTLGPGIAPGFLSEQRLNDELARFDKVVITPRQHTWDESLVPCLALLPPTVTRLQIDNCQSEGFSLNFPDSAQLESLHLTFSSMESGANSFVLPTTLSDYGYAYISPFVCPKNDLLAFFVDSCGATDHFLQSFPFGPTLTNLKMGWLYFGNKTLSEFLRMVRDDLPNLCKISFQDVTFGIDKILEEFSTDKGKDARSLPFQRIEFEKCMMLWDAAVDLMLRISYPKTVIISLRAEDELADVYKLTPKIKQKGAKLELMITSISGSRDPAEISVPSELTDVLSKLELIGIQYTKLLQGMFGGDDPFEVLTDIRLEDCKGLGDATLESVAKRCRNLKKLKFQPHHCPGLEPVTDQCLQPFMVHWDDRKSTQLSIECLHPARPFDGFDLPSDQEKGVFSDGKKWTVVRKAFLLDGCDELGTRLVIWDDQIDEGEKSMVITNYKRNFENNIQISVANGKCIVKQNRGVKF